MSEPVLAAVFVVLVWWASTGVILCLGALPRRTHSWSMAAMTLVLGAGLWGLAASADDPSAGGAVAGFLGAIAVWGWIETSFLLGYITGPRTAPCPPEARGWPRFRLAVAALLYHEAAILAGALAVLAATWRGENLTGLFTFLLLLAMRLSAKLNLFLGVPHFTDTLLPGHLAYLKSYFRRSAVSIFFPASVVTAGLGAGLLAIGAVSASSGGEATRALLLFTLLALAILEHIFMAWPLGDAALWRWALPEGGTRAKDEVNR